MKLLILVSFFTVCTLSLLAQKTEYSVHAQTGLFHFGGKSAEKSSFINSSYTNNPYGTGSSFSYAFYFQVQRITKKNTIWGLQSGYELLASRIKIDEVYIDDMIFKSDGHTSLRNQFILVHPYAGHRFNFGIPLDISVGPDLGIGLKSMEKGTVPDFNLQIKNERDIPAVDARIRINATAYHKSMGFTVGYSYGTINYQANMIGAEPETYSRFLRIGLSYKLPF
ncbi:hypothetical protein [Arcticibacter tournemirensis]|uniref:PorT family protein n=1 Tax=Arcticibacter tournemirensis TaxID=699437 RepID=A0A4Q0MER4_9SPHI|nr:hypothetical protein [Arcticibacter tournemirensis]RXF71940.1 hypothetical protein EKH83_04465 [Arcticibacter tournemirensis]